MPRIGLLWMGLALITPVWSQDRVDSVHRVDAGAMYHRVYAIVPMVGTGKPGDPRRPKFAPLHSEMKQDHSGILGFQMQISDDGKTALVEFVGVNRAALMHIIQSTEPDMKIFEKGKNSKDEIEAEFQKQKKGFKLDGLMTARPQ